ncbi:hypothetical protein [Methylobacterium sp. CM6257]
MEDLRNYLTRQQVREKTGWSLTFIDRHVPRTKIGGKVLIPLAELDRLLDRGTVR